jgi:transposase-like protein
MSLNITKSSIDNLLKNSLFNLREASSPLGLDEFILRTIEILMQIEREEHLKAMKSQDVNDKSNGYYNRNFKSLLQNHLRINIPRTRNGNFNPTTIELVKASNDQVHELVLSLYKKGMTSRDISDLLSDFFCEKLSKSSISNLARTFADIRLAWNNSKLEEEYLVVFCDAIYITVKRGGRYSKEAVFIAYGVRKDYKRELLILESSPVESSVAWDEYFKQLKERGVKHIDLIVADGIKGFENQVMVNFPNSNLQKCVVHKMRNVTKHVSPKDKKEMYQDLKHVFDNFDHDASTDKAYKKSDEFCNKWEFKYPSINKYFKKEDFDYYLTYIKYNHNVRRYIYTTNSIESLNAKIRKATKNKLSFEKTDYLLDYLFVIIKEYQDNNWMVFPVNNFRFLK